MSTEKKMAIVDRSLRRVRSLEATEIVAVIDIFGLGGMRLAQHEAAARRVMDDLRPSEVDIHWLTCYCKPQASEPPLLGPVEKANRLRFLRRVSRGQRTAHDDDCDFVRTEEEQVAVARSFRKPRANAKFDLLPSFTEQANLPPGDDDESVPIHGRRSVMTAGRPKLGQLLLALIGGAGLNVVRTDGRVPDGRESEKLLRLAAERLGFKAANGVPIEEVLFFGPRGLELRADGATSLIEQKFRSLSAHWPDASRPYVLYVSELGRSTKEKFGEAGNEGKILTEYLIRNPIHAGGFGNELRASPYIAAAIYGQLDATGPELGLISCFAIPSHEWRARFPVDSRFESWTLEILHSIQRDLREEGYRIKIEKPLFNMLPAGDAARGLVCIPDFLISVRQRNKNLGTVVVETMGGTQPTYLASKRRTIPVMEGFGPVVKHMLGQFWQVREDARQAYRLSEEQRFRERVLSQIRALPNRLQTPPEELL
jgi:hypothetical protein